MAVVAPVAVAEGLVSDGAVVSLAGAEYGAGSPSVPTPTARTWINVFENDEKMPTPPAPVTVVVEVAASMIVPGDATSATVSVAVPPDTVSVSQ